MHSSKTAHKRHMFSPALYPFSGGVSVASAPRPVSAKAKAMASTARKVIKNAPKLKTRRNLRMAIPSSGMKGLGDIGTDDLDGCNIANMAAALEGLGEIDVDSMDDGDLLAAINAVDPDIVDDLDSMVDAMSGLGAKKKAVDPKRLIFRLTRNGWIQKTPRGWVKSKTPPPAGAQIVQAAATVAKKAVAKGKAVPAAPAPAAALPVYQPTLSTNQPTLVSSSPTASYPAYTPSASAPAAPAYSDAPYAAPAAPAFNPSLVPTFTPQPEAPEAPAAYDGSYDLPQGERVIETSEGYIDETGEYVDESAIEEGAYMGALGFSFGKFLKKALPIAAAAIPFVGPVAGQIITGLSQGLDVKDPKTGKPLLPPETGTVQTLPDGRQGLISAQNQILATRKDAASPWVPYVAPKPAAKSPAASSSMSSVLPWLGIGAAALAFLA